MSVVAPPAGWAPRPIRRVIRSTAVPVAPVVTNPPIPSYDISTGEAISRTIEWEVNDTAERRAVPVVYGRVKFAPKCVYLKVSTTYLEAVVLLGEGPIESVEKIWINDDEVYPTAVSWCDVEVSLGTTSQAELTIPSDSGWATSYPGYALAALEINLMADEYSGYGMPDIRVDLKGRKVFDPSSGTTAWTQNPILIARDILTNQDYGLGIPSWEIDESGITAAAEVCDVDVSGEERYRANIMLTDRISAGRAIQDLMMTCGGRFGWWDSKYRFVVDWTGSSVATIDENGGTGAVTWESITDDWETITDNWEDISVGDTFIPILPSSGGVSSLRCLARRDDAPNSCLVTFTDEDDWLSKEVRYDLSAVATGAEQPRELRIQALAVPSASQAYRLAKQWVLQAQRRRYGLAVPQHGIYLAPGDLVTVTSSVGPLSSQVCRVQSISDRPDGAFELELLEYSASDYSSDTHTPDDPTLPDSFDDSTLTRYIDDFRSGQDADGYFGELGWNVTHNTGSNATTYATYADHPGVIKNSCGSTDASTAGIALNNEQQKFAPNSVWATKWIWRTNIADATNQYAQVSINGPVTFLFRVAVKEDNLLYIDDVSTGLSYTDEAWITVEAWCAGDGTMYYSVRWETNEVTGDTSVSSTTADHFIAMYHQRSAAGVALQIVTEFDYVHLILGTNR